MTESDEKDRSGSSASPSPTSSKGERVRPGSERPIVVLIVDDHPLVRSELPDLLTRHANFSALTAPSVEIALRVLQENAVDVVLADLRLGRPGEADGGDLLDAVARWHRGVGRVLFSVDGLGEEVARSLGHAWCPKDAPIAELVVVLRENAYRG